ncbi:hypothetical protein RYX36_019758 [Vicia faba]
MPLNIDLNSPYVDHEMMECNIAPSINLNDPSSSNDNEVEHGFPNHDEDIDVDALYSNEEVGQIDHGICMEKEISRMQIAILGAAIR